MSGGRDGEEETLLPSIMNDLGHCKELLQSLRALHHTACSRRPGPDRKEEDKQHQANEQRLALEVQVLASELQQERREREVLMSQHMVLRDMLFKSYGSLVDDLLDTTQALHRKERQVEELLACTHQPPDSSVSERGASSAPRVRLLKIQARGPSPEPRAARQRGRAERDQGAGAAAAGELPAPEASSGFARLGQMLGQQGNAHAAGQGGGGASSHIDTHDWLQSLPRPSLSALSPGSVMESPPPYWPSAATVTSPAALVPPQARGLSRNHSDTAGELDVRQREGLPRVTSHERSQRQTFPLQFGGEQPLGRQAAQPLAADGGGSRLSSGPPPPLLERRQRVGHGTAHQGGHGGGASQQAGMGWLHDVATAAAAFGALATEPQFSSGSSTASLASVPYLGKRHTSSSCSEGSPYMGGGFTEEFTASCLATPLPTAPGGDGGSLRLPRFVVEEELTPSSAGTVTALSYPDPWEEAPAQRVVAGQEEGRLGAAVQVHAFPRNGSQASGLTRRAQSVGGVGGRGGAMAVAADSWVHQTYSSQGGQAHHPAPPAHAFPDEASSETLFRAIKGQLDNLQASFADLELEQGSPPPADSSLRPASSLRQELQDLAATAAAAEAELRGASPLTSSSDFIWPNGQAAYHGPRTAAAALAGTGAAAAAPAGPRAHKAEAVRKQDGPLHAPQGFVVVGAGAEVPH